MGGAAGVLLHEWIFLYVMVGSVRGEVGPKELMGLAGTVTDYRPYSPTAHHVPSRLKQSFLRHAPFCG